MEAKYILAFSALIAIAASASLPFKDCGKCDRTNWY